MQGHYKQLNVDCFHNIKITWFFKKKKKKLILYIHLTKYSSIFTAGLFYSFLECLGANSVQLSYKSYPIRLVRGWVPSSVIFHSTWRGLFNQVLESTDSSTVRYRGISLGELWEMKIPDPQRVWFWRLRWHPSLHFNKLRRSSLAII